MSNTIQMKTNSVFFLIIGCALFVVAQFSCTTRGTIANYQVDTIYTNQNLSGVPLDIVFEKGHAHNHPLMAVWVTDTHNNYIETLFIAESIGKGVFQHGDESKGKWMPGEVRRPAALPVWSHSRGVKEKDGLFIPLKDTPMPDAITGATPPGNFILKTKISENILKYIYLYLEINQSWDWNEYWTNNKYPEDADYKSSCQPALVYKAKIDLNSNEGKTELKLIGHAHHSGKDGIINPNLETISTAKNITGIVFVRKR